MNSRLKSYLKRFLTALLVVALIIPSSSVLLSSFAAERTVSDGEVTDSVISTDDVLSDTDPKEDDKHIVNWSGLSEKADLKLSVLNEEAIAALHDQLPEEDTILAAFDLKLKEGTVLDRNAGAEISVSGYQIDDPDHTVLYHFKDNEEAEKLEYVYTKEGEETFLRFRTTDFSPFAIVEEPFYYEEEVISEENAPEDSYAKETEDVVAEESEEYLPPLEAGKVSENTPIRSSVRLLASDSPAGNESYITYFYTQAFYGGTWEDTNGDGVAEENTSRDHYVWNANYSAAGHRMSFRLNFQIGNQSGLNPGDVQMRIPKRILKDRDGVYADDYEMSVPSREEVESGAEISSDAMYAYYEEGDEIVIYNFRPIDSEQEGYVEVSYLTSETSFYYADMEEAGIFNANLSLKDSVQDKKADAEPLHVMINTGATVKSVVKNYPTLSKNWDSSWGVKPDDADNYWYLQWLLATTVDTDSTQPYTLTFTDSPLTNDMEVVGYKLSGASTYTMSNTTDVQTRVGIRYDYVLTRVPKDPYAKIDAWAEAENQWTVTNQIKVTLTPNDGKDPASNVNTSRDYTYKFKSDLSPTGLWNSWKRSDGTFRTYFPSSVFTNSRSYGVFDNLPFKAGEYSRYDLDEFQNGNIEKMDNFDYAVWGIGFTGPYTVKEGGDFNDPNDYFQNKVTYVLTDDDFNGDSFTAGARTDHHDGKFLEDGEERLEMTSSEDFQIDELYYHFFIQDGEYDPDEIDFIAKTGVYDLTDKVDFYAKFGNVDQDWVNIGWYNFGTNQSEFDSTYVKESNRSHIVFQDNCVSYKLVVSHSHFYGAIGAVPYFTLKNSDRVLAYAEGKDVISFYNGSNFRVFTANEYDTSESEDFLSTSLYDRDRYDINFATGAERSSDIVKSVVSSFNDTKQQRYVISWRIRMEENLKSGMDGTLSSINQDGGIFYDLLPAGCTLEEGSVAVRNNLVYLEDGDFAVNQIMNYKNTGRTLLVVEVLKPGTNYSVYFNTLHDWSSINDYGHDVYNPVAYQTGNDVIADGFADDGGEIAEADLMADLDPDNGDAARFIYSENEYDITTIIAAANGLQKLIREENDEDFSYKTFTNINGNYVYRLRYSSTANMTSENLIFFDSLENYTDEEVRSDWYGKLQDIDISQPQSMGVAPVVYLRTDRFDVSTYDVDSDWDTILDRSWTDMDTFLSEGHSLEDAKAVAIDLRHDENGDQYELDSLQSLSVLLYMKAPPISPDTEDEGYPWAYNNIYLSGIIYHTDGTTQPFYNHHDYTAIGLRIAGDVNLLKVNSENENETIPGIKFHLWGRSDYGTDIDRIEVSNARGQVNFRGIEKGTYTLQEYESTDDWLLNAAEYQVIIGEDGSTTIKANGKTQELIDGRLKVPNTPRVHGDLDFFKMSSIMFNEAYPRIAGVRFKLSGTSDYGTDILMYATSSSTGAVSFVNIEKGTYALVEIETDEDYLLNDTVFTVRVNDFGIVSITAPDGKEVYLGEQNGTQVIFNTPRYWSFALTKLSKEKDETLTHTLQGAEFSLTGTSNYGTEYNEKAVSNENGLAFFDDIEAGTYILKETKAPTGLDEDGKIVEEGSLNYQADPVMHVVVISEDGSVTIDGLEQDEDGIFGVAGAWLVYNTPKLDKEITVYKYWNPSAPEDVFDWGERTADPEGEKNGPTVYISTKNPAGSASGDGGSDTGNGDDPAPTDNPSDDPADGSTSIETDGNKTSSIDFGFVKDAWNAFKSLFVVTAYAAEGDIASGTCGTCDWVIDADGKLTISPSNGTSGILGSSSGSGSQWPWFNNRNDIKSVVVEDGVKAGSSLKNMFGPESSANTYANLTSVDLSKLDTSGVADMSYMFYNCRNLSSLNISSFDTSAVTNMSYMFYNCNALTELDLSGFNTSNTNTMRYMFAGCNRLQTLNISNFNTSAVTTMGNMFDHCQSLTSLDLSHFNTSKVTSMAYMFNYCEALTSLNLSNFDTSQVTNFTAMFQDCRALPSIDITHFDTSNANNFSSMFGSCASLESIDVTRFDTSNATSMSSMFSGCSSLTQIDVSKFDTSKVSGYGLQFMFNGCSNLTNLDLSNFNTEKATNLTGMFRDCSNLQSINISSFNTSNVVNMRELFSGCRSLTALDLSHFDTSKVTNMGAMFKNCSSLTKLDLSNFDTSSLTGVYQSAIGTPDGMREMFSGCSSLASLDLSSFDGTVIKDMTSAFSDCDALAAIALGENTTAGGRSIWRASGISENWVKYAELTGKMVYGGEEVVLLWNAEEYPGWYVKADAPIPADLDFFYEYVSEEDDQTNVWVKEEDVWSYTFLVADDTKTYYIWEDPVEGFSSSADVSTPIELVPGTSQIISILNSKDTGSLSLEKKINTDESITDSFSFTIQLEGDGIKGTQIFGDVAFNNGVGKVSLANGESVTISGIPLGTSYTVTEDAVAGYEAPEWSGDAAGTISEQKKDISIICTNTPTPPPDEEPANLTVKKLVSGYYDPDNSGEYTFTAAFSGLAKLQIYEYKIGKGEDSELRSFTTDAEGSANVTFTLQADETAVFIGLIIGSKYQVTEDGGNWTGSYEVSDANGVNVITNTSGSGTIGTSLSTAVETIDKDEDDTAEDVTVTFTNRLHKTQDIKIKKVIEPDIVSDDEFSFTIVFDNLVPGEYYNTDIGRILADADGHAERQFSMKQNDELYIYGLPIGAAYQIKEGSNAYIASYVITNAGEKGSIINDSDANSDNNKDLSTAQEIVEEGEEITVTFTNLMTTEIEVAKQWDDGDDADGRRPAVITFQLYKTVGGETSAVEGSTIVLDPSMKDAADPNKWTATFKNLPVVEDGKEITYSIKELDAQGAEVEDGGAYDENYMTSYGEDRLTITNAYKPEMTEVAGTKTWNDEDNQYGKRPESITVTLLANGEPALDAEGNPIAVVVTEEDDWSYAFTGLPKNKGGEEIRYTVLEEPLEEDGYNADYDGFDIINTYTPEKRDISVRKVWDDVNDKDKKRPAGVEVTLLADGEAADVKDAVITLNSKNEWAYTWKDLPKYKGEKLIEYTVEEKKVPDYTTTITGEASTGFVITNKYVPPKEVVTGDRNNIAFFAALFGAAFFALAAIILTGIVRRRRKNK